MEGKLFLKITGRKIQTVKKDFNTSMSLKAISWHQITLLKLL